MDNSSTIFDESKWLSFKKNLKKNVGDSAFNNWLKHLKYVSVEDEEAREVIAGFIEKELS